MANIITHQNPVYAGIPKKWVQVTDGDGTYYCEVIALSGGGGLSSVATDNTLTGDGTAGDPLSQQGGVGGPIHYQFSVRGAFPAGAATYAPIAQGGSIGAGGYDAADPTNPANFNMQFATPFPAGTFSKIFIYSTAGPGVGESISYELQIAGATPVNGPKVTFTGDPNDQVKSGSDAAHTATVAADGLVSLLITPSAGATRGAFTGYVLFTPTP